MLKKILVKLIAIVLLLIMIFVIGACNMNKSNSQSQKIVYYYVAGSDSDLLSIIRRYNKYCLANLDETYQIELVEFDSDKIMYEKLSAEIMAGKGPDLISLDQCLPFEKMIEGNVFADIDEVMQMYNFNIPFDNCQQSIMDSGIYNGKRIFAPLYYCPNVFLTTSETLNEHGINVMEQGVYSLFENLDNNLEGYSLFGNYNSNKQWLYSFIYNHIDYENKAANFDSQFFLENIDIIMNLIKNDDTNKNGFYGYDSSLNGKCLFRTPDNVLGGSIHNVLNFYYAAFLDNRTPLIIPNCNSGQGVFANVQCGIALNNNSSHKEKALYFIKYCLSEDIQSYWCGAMKEENSFSGSNTLALPVNNAALEKSIMVALNQKVDCDGNEQYSESEIEFSNNIKLKFEKDYLSLLPRIQDVCLYNYEQFDSTYFISNVIGDIIEDYFNGVTTKQKFVAQLSSATELYLIE